MSAEARVPARGARSAPVPAKIGPMPPPIDKAAMILAAIGPELAAGFLRDIGAADMERFAQAVSGLGTVPQEMLDAVIVEFLEALTEGPEVQGGARTARKLLSGVLGDGEVSRLLGGAPVEEPGLDPRSTWDRLNESPVPAIAGFLSAEHPQTAAVILSELRADVAASVLERLERSFAQDVVLRLSRVPTLDPPVARSIETAIERDFLSALRLNLSKRRPADLIAGLMNNISTEARAGFLGYLETREPGLAQDVQRTMFTFEDMPARVHGRDVAGALRDVPEDVLLRALRHGQAADSPAVAFVLENLPRRLAERYAEELAGLGEIPRKQGEAAQIELTKAILAQAKSGQIRFVEKESPGG
jgi:flagellar motor switch protein FliG